MGYIVVLGARVIRSPDGLLEGALARRVRAAARVHHARGWPVVASGGALWNNERECDAMKVFLQELGVNTVLTEGWSRDTGENAARCRQLLGTPKIVLVTCNWHMKRARRYFERAEFSVSAVSVFGPQTSRPRSLVRLCKEEVLSWLVR